MTLQAELHTWNVVIRHTRYRDLAKSIWGEWQAVFCRSCMERQWELAFVAALSQTQFQVQMQV